MKTIDTTASSATAYYAGGTITERGSRLLHVSGQPGSNDGQVPADYVSQIHLALLNLHRVLATAGAHTRDIVKLNLYIVDYDPENRLHTRPLKKWLGSHRPAITLIPISALAVAGWLFEIDAVVALLEPLPRLIQNPKKIEDFDVAVIGAGLSGLTTAEAVVKSGYSCIILEARDRVGGRTWSQALGQGGDSAIVDLGAAWINDSNQSRMIGLARRAGVDLITQNTVGNCMLQTENGQLVTFPYGTTPLISARVQTQMEEIRDRVEADCQRVDCSHPRDAELDSLTFLAYLQSHNASEMAISNASVWTRAMLGHEPQDISALFFLNYCKSGGGLLQMRSDREHGGQYLRVRQGTQTFAKTIAAALPENSIRFKQRVAKVEQSSNSVLVETSDSVIRARKVVSSVPFPVLKTVSFEPPLPPKKQLLADSYRYGYYTKVMAIFRSPWWTTRGFCGLAQSYKGPVAVFRDTSSSADNKWVLTCFLAGDSGESWSHLPSPQERQEAILEQLGDMYGDKALPTAEFEGMVGHEWSTEEFSGYGCPSCALAPGVLSMAGDALREPFGNVHFVGTETAAEWKGYMEGAVRSGERGASEVLRGLKRTPSHL